MKTEKLQVIFIVRNLWGGGVEKVVYDLAHGLDKDIFTPIIIYLIEDWNPIEYDKSIKTICLQPIIEEVQKQNHSIISRLKAIEIFSFRQKIFNFLLRIYSVVPKNTRKKIGIYKWVKDITARSENKKNINSAPISSNLYYDIPNSIEEIWWEVLALRKTLENFSDKVILIPMDELNTVILWLSQIPPVKKVLAAQHYPYSQALTFRYADEKVRRVKEWFYTNACRSANIVTFDSQGSRDDFINKFGASPKQTIFMANPINCDLVIEKSLQPINIDKKILQNKTVFTQVARLNKEKNPLLLVEACDLLRKRDDNFIVLLIGNGPLYSIVQQEIAKRNLQNHIIMVGEQTNPYPFMRIARALLLTSIAESAPLVLVESMLCGTVPISTNILAGPSELLDNGKFGILVSPGDPQAFSDAMFNIAHDDVLWQQLQNNAKNHAYRFDVKKVLKEWEELIIKISRSSQ